MADFLAFDAVYVCGKREKDEIDGVRLSESFILSLTPIIKADIVTFTLFLDTIG